MRTIRDHRAALTRALVLPYVLLLAIRYVASPALPGYLSILALAVELAVLTIFAISIHRIVLLGPGSVPRWGIRKWTMRETYFAAHLGVLTVMLVIFSYSEKEFIGPVALIVAAYLVSRLSLVFPGAAIDQGVTFRQSWVWTRNNQLFVIVVIALLPVVFYLALSILLVILNSLFSFALTWFRVALPAIELVFVVLFTSALSLAYREIVDRQFAS